MKLHVGTQRLLLLYFVATVVVVLVVAVMSSYYAATLLRFSIYRQLSSGSNSGLTGGRESCNFVSVWQVPGEVTCPAGGWGVGGGWCALVGYW